MVTAAGVGSGVPEPQRAPVVRNLAGKLVSGHHANDAQRGVVERQRPTEHIWIRREFRAPQAIADHDAVVGLVGDIGFSQCAAERGRTPKEPEHATSDARSDEPLGSPVRRRSESALNASMLSNDVCIRFQSL